jgi:hypothetical protein
MTTNPRGGQRTGAGRKRLAPDGMVSHNITLSADDWAVVETLGNGNRSAGVRSLVEMMREEYATAFTPSSPHTPDG